MADRSIGALNVFIIEKIYAYLIMAIGDKNMFRTTVMLPTNLKKRAQLFASKKGISFGELVRESLEEKLEQAKIAKKSDPFFDDSNFFNGDIPKDLSAKHDAYLP